jgi:hypothetical protein
MHGGNRGEVVGIERAAELLTRWKRQLVLLGVCGCSPLQVRLKQGIRGKRGRREMYRIPKDLDLSPVIGESTTQARVGQFDLPFTFGDVTFAIESPVNLFRDGNRIAHWEAGQWPEPGFYDILNTEVRRCEVVNDRVIVFEFDNGVEMDLEDNSDQVGSMQISIAGSPNQWII